MTTDADRAAARELVQGMITDGYVGSGDASDVLLHRSIHALATARAEGREEMKARREETVAMCEQLRLDCNTAYTRGWQAAVEAAAQMITNRLSGYGGAQIAAAIRALTPPAEQETP